MYKQYYTIWSAKTGRTIMRFESLEQAIDQLGDGSLERFRDFIKSRNARSDYVFSKV